MADVDPDQFNGTLADLQIFVGAKSGGTDGGGGGGGGGTGGGSGSDGGSAAGDDGGNGSVDDGGKADAPGGDLGGANPLHQAGCSAVGGQPPAPLWALFLVVVMVGRDRVRRRCGR